MLGKSFKVLNIGITHSVIHEGEYIIALHVINYTLHNVTVYICEVSFILDETRIYHIRKPLWCVMNVAYWFSLNKTSTLDVRTLCQ